MLLQICLTIKYHAALITRMPFPGHTMTLRLHVNTKTLLVFKGRIALLTSEPDTLVFDRDMMAQLGLASRLIATFVAKELNPMMLCVHVGLECALAREYRGAEVTGHLVRFPRPALLGLVVVYSNQVLLVLLEADGHMAALGTIKRPVAVLLLLVRVEVGLEGGGVGALVAIVVDAFVHTILVDLEDLWPVAGELTLVAGVWVGGAVGGPLVLQQVGSVVKRGGALVAVDLDALVHGVNVHNEIPLELGCIVALVALEPRGVMPFVHVHSELCRVGEYKLALWARH